VPLGFSIWFAHYGFHFATGALSLIPALHNFLVDHGILWFGGLPDWTLSALLPFEWLLPLQMLVTLIGFGGSFYVLNEIGRRHRGSFVAQLPWILLISGIALAAVWLFNQPMEMRGVGILN
jgi:hypothetical protein